MEKSKDNKTPVLVLILLLFYCMLMLILMRKCAHLLCLFIINSLSDKTQVWEFRIAASIISEIFSHCC